MRVDVAVHQVGTMSACWMLTGDVGAHVAPRAKRAGYPSGGSGQRHFPPAGRCGHPYAEHLHGT